MLMSKELLFDRLFGDSDWSSPPLNVHKQTLGAVRSRYVSRGELSVSFGVICTVARAKGINPTLALLSLVALRLQKKEGRDAKMDPNLATEVQNVLESLAQTLPADSSLQRTLQNFPRAFKGPFYIVTGDRRETKKEKWITPADFGVVSSSAAELRYVAQLGLPRDTQIVTDKMFILTPYDELCKRFAEATIVCVGSPASNALSRILNRYCIHRYNLEEAHYKLVEDFVRDAWQAGSNIRSTGAAPASPDPQLPFFAAPTRVSKFDGRALESFLDQKRDLISWMKYSTYTGGLIDPAYALRIRGLDAPPDGDFGLITMARNPFRGDNDGKYPAIVISGYHLPGTYYALHPSIWTDQDSWFQKHPLGGIIKVDLRPPASPGQDYTFYERMENFNVAWDDNSDYDIANLISGLKEMSLKGGGICHLTRKEASDALDFVRNLLGMTEQSPMETVANGGSSEEA